MGLREEIKNMNKMKVMVITVLMVLVVGSLHAQTKINESKLTDISYVSQICDVKVAFQTEHGVGYTLDNGMGFYNATTNGRVMCIIVKNGKAYGRYVLADKGGKVTSYNIHDDLCKTNYSISEEDRFNLTIGMVYTLAQASTAMGLDKYIK